MPQNSGAQQPDEVLSPSDQAINHFIDSLAYLIDDEITAQQFFADTAGDLNTVVSGYLAGSDIAVLNNPAVAGAIGQGLEATFSWVADNHGEDVNAGAQGFRDALNRAAQQYEETGAFSQEDLVDSLGVGIGNAAETLLRDLRVPLLDSQLLPEPVIQQTGSVVESATVLLVNNLPGLVSQVQGLVDGISAAVPDTASQAALAVASNQAWQSMLVSAA